MKSLFARLKAAWQAFRNPEIVVTDEVASAHTFDLERERAELATMRGRYEQGHLIAQQRIAVQRSFLTQVLGATTLWAAQYAARRGLES